MSLLAWLMLVLNAAHALPMAAMAQAVSASATSAMTMPAAMAAGHMMSCDHAAPDHADPSLADDCCGTGAADGACHCPTMCAPALLPVPMLSVAAHRPHMALAPGLIDSAPRRPVSPPLRPPQR
jgi:hypothetical protein